MSKTMSDARQKYRSSSCRSERDTKESRARRGSGQAVQRGAAGAAAAASGMGATAGLSAVAGPSSAPAVCCPICCRLAGACPCCCCCCCCCRCCLIPSSPWCCPSALQAAVGTGSVAGTSIGGHLAPSPADATAEPPRRGRGALSPLAALSASETVEAATPSGTATRFARQHDTCPYAAAHAQASWPLNQRPALSRAPPPTTRPASWAVGLTALAVQGPA
jgi:hypothetical protein